MPKILLTDYMPTPDQLEVSDILDARQRAVTLLKAWWPQLDTRPGSVFGDIHMTPYAVMLSSLEVALEKILSDIDLAEVAKGRIYNPTFVEAFLKNFGVVTRGEVNSSGVIQLTFSENKIYVIDGDAEFTIGGKIFKLNNSEGNPLTIYPKDSTGGRRVLAQKSEGKFVVLLPVTGSPGSSVKDGTTGTSNITQTELISIEAVGDFDSGLTQETLPELASRAQTGFAAASLSNRSGTLSFLNSKYPQLLGASVVVTGDREMIRDNSNPLGIAEGTIDIYVRSRANYTLGEAIVKLIYDSTQQGWVGKLSLPVIPAFFSLREGVFQVGNFNNDHALNQVFARSVHPTIDNLGVAYSRYEELGILVTDATPENFENSSIGTVTRIAGPSATLPVTGEFAGSVFGDRASRHVSLRFEGVTTINSLPASLATVRDMDTGETKYVYFVGNQSVGPTYGTIQKDISYAALLNGLNIDVRPDSGTFVPADLVGAVFEFSFTGRSANFSVNYLYDPEIVQVDSALQDPDNKPVATTVITKSAIVCNVDIFAVQYRVNSGSNVDLVTARQEIFDYVNGLIFPNLYEESRVGEIMLRNGAAGLIGVTKRGLFYPSLAKIYVDKAGVQQTISRLSTGTLTPPVNSFGVGSRNVAYLLSLDTITFNAIRI
jgi:hypothetical protein